MTFYGGILDLQFFSRQSDTTWSCEPMDTGPMRYALCCLYVYVCLSPSFHWYQFIVLGNRHNEVQDTCLGWLELALVSIRLVLLMLVVFINCCLCFFVLSLYLADIKTCFNINVRCSCSTVTGYVHSPCVPQQISPSSQITGQISVVTTNSTRFPKTILCIYTFDKDFWCSMV